MDESNPCRLVRETCEFVIQNSEAVTIDPNAIHHFVDTVNNEMMDTLKPNVFNRGGSIRVSASLSPPLLRATEILGSL
jgi:hypothetical protein